MYCRYCKEGSIIATKDVGQYVDEVSEETLELKVYMPINDGEYISTLYVDDGETINSEYDSFVFKLTKVNGNTNIEINREGNFNKVKGFYLTFNGSNVEK